MKTAKKLRKESIAEYLLYMWQIEDIIRACGCSLPVIEKAYISKFTDYSQEEQEEEADWFADLIRMMNEEGKREFGHLNINKVLMEDLIDLHKRLLASDRFPLYNAEYYKVLPFIVELREYNRRAAQKRAEEYGIDEQEALEEVGGSQDEIETCFNAVYGVMLLHMQKKEVTPATQHAVEEISKFLATLSAYYLEDETKGLKWSDD
ncbi:DUF4924 family protein [Prevotella sp. AGR2160]|uniref:DUF4924 family protein n=1 Tax=Prevotella sp. AGR2160 TaxID=1280674 RepID=UPI0005626DBF|nr:DUF4924 family protein [Prevotella sp. AGR2160]